jgi:hypothetical protein
LEDKAISWFDFSLLLFFYLPFPSFQLASFSSHEVGVGGEPTIRNSLRISQDSKFSVNLGYLYQPENNSKLRINMIFRKEKTENAS